MKHSQTNHYVIMFFIMLLSGLLSTMNVWVDKIDDIRIDFNFRHCPLNGALLIDNGSFIEVFLSPYTKNYFTNMM